MPTPPEGAQLSEDGHYWWDGENWQLVDDTAGGAGGGTGDAGAGGTAPSGGAGGDAAGAAGGGDPGAGGNEWPPAGYPPDPANWTPEQLQYWFGNTQDESQDVALSGDVMQPLAIADLEGSSNEGIA